MGYGPGGVAVESLFAVVTMAPGGVVAAAMTHASAHPPRQLVEFHVEATFPGVQVTVTGWGGRERKVSVMRVRGER